MFDKYRKLILTLMTALTFFVPAYAQVDSYNPTMAPFQRLGRIMPGVGGTEHYGVFSNDCDKGLIQHTSVTLSTTNVTGMFGTAVPLIAAPGAGHSIIVTNILFRTVPGATAFTGGGAITIQYHGGAALTNTIAAAVVTSASVSDTVRDGLDVTATQNAAIEITNATAAFATGNGSEIVDISYRVL